MSKLLPDGLDTKLRTWIEAQPMFFVGTAPGPEGHLNVSPKGYDTLRVLGPHRLAYRDLTGSTAESAAHLRSDGRIVLLRRWVDGRTDDDLDAYRARKNATSINGLPAIPVREPAATGGDDPS